MMGLDSGCDHLCLLSVSKVVSKESSQVKTQELITDKDIEVRGFELY